MSEQQRSSSGRSTQRKSEPAFDSRQVSFWDDLWTKLRRYRRRLGRGSQRVFRYAVLPIFMVYWTLVGLTFRVWLLLRLGYYQFVAFLWWSRNRRHFWQGLPAFFAVLAVIGLVGVSHAFSGKWSDRYRDAALQAYRRGEYAVAKLCYERFLAMVPEDKEAEFDLALTLFQLGEKRRALAIMERLARGPGVGMFPAQRWLGKYFLNLETPQTVDVYRSRAYEYLSLARAQRRDDPELNELLFQYYVREGRVLDAAAALERLVRVRPGWLFELSLLYAQLGNVTAAKDAAERAVTYYTDLLSREPLNDEARLRLASLQMNLGNGALALGTLLDGLSVRPQGPYQRAVAAAFVALHDLLPGNTPQDIAQRIEFLRQALQYDPTFEPAIERIIRLADEHQRPETEALLHAVLARGAINPFVHFALGVQAWRRGDLDAAEKHLHRAWELDNRLLVVANNLAWTLANRDPPDLTRALELIEHVLRQQPDDLRFRETRGQILVKLGRFAEALDDLERALPGHQNDPVTHQALAAAYRGLGQEDMARLHERQAERLRQQQAPEIKPLR